MFRYTLNITSTSSFIMKNTAATRIYFYFLISLFQTSTLALEDVQLIEDQQFWDRFLQGDGLSVPTKPPMPSAPSPVVSPVVSPVICNVEVSVDCSTSDETTQCNELQTPDPVCAGGANLNFVQFGLDAGKPCDPSSNSQGAFCQDCANFTGTSQDEFLLVLCKNAATGENLTVVPSLVRPRGVFTVSSSMAGVALPDSIDCIYVEGEKKKIQQNIINTSGDASLNLKEEFGAFSLLSCASGLPNATTSKTCLETVSYFIEIKNVGSVEIDVTMVDFIDQSVKTSFAQDVVTPVKAGETSFIETLVNVDICVGRQICVQVNVEAEPNNGETCRDTDTYCFQTRPLPPVPLPPPVPVPVKSPTVVPPLPRPVTYPITPPVTPPVKSPVPPPLPLPVPVPLKSPTVVVPPAPQPVPLPVTQPVTPPVKSPVAPPVPVPFPVPQPVPLPVAPPPVPLQLPPPVIPTAPVAAPKSKGSMSPSGSMSSGSMASGGRG
jgi:hypothetical protein